MWLVLKTRHPFSGIFPPPRDFAKIPIAFIYYLRIGHLGTGIQLYLGYIKKYIDLEYYYIFISLSYFF